MLTQAERARRYRERKAGRLPEVQTCSSCGKRLRTDVRGGLCHACWLKTDAGRENVRERVQRSRLRNQGPTVADPVT